MTTLHSDPQLKAAKVLVQDGGETTIKFRELDISNDDSIHAFRDFLKKEHSECIDAVVNNAGAAFDGFGEFASCPLIRKFQGSFSRLKC